MPRMLRPAHPVLSGRITDEDGLPVTDGRIQIIHVESGIGDQEARTTRTGKYSVQRVNRGESAQADDFERPMSRLHAVQRVPGGCARSHEAGRSQLYPQAGLPGAVQALDEDGHAVPNVQFFMRWIVNGQFPTTDQEGWATIGGLNPSLTEVTFGVYHTDFEMRASRQAG